MPSKYRWDTKSLRFRGPSGQFVKRDAVMTAMEAGIQETRTRVVRLSNQLQRGEINLAQWLISVRDEIKAQHTLSAGIARGGKAQMSPAEWGRVGARTRKQYEYLSGFGRDIESGRQKLDGRFLNRVQMYANIARGTFSDTERRMKRDAGYDEERNILSGRETCPGCSSETAKGWVKVGSISPIGSRECLTNCKCQIISRKTA